MLGLSPQEPITAASEKAGAGAGRFASAAEASWSIYVLAAAALTRRLWARGLSPARCSRKAALTIAGESTSYPTS